MSEVSRSTTEYLGLIKPNYEDEADIDDLNDDMDIVDLAVKNIITSIAPLFAEDIANDAGTYVTYENEFYYLPSGHTANDTWEDTTSVKKSIGQVICGKIDKNLGQANAGKFLVVGDDGNVTLVEISSASGVSF